MENDDFGCRFIELVLRISKFTPFYIDAYSGPLAIKQKIDNEQPRSPEVLLKNCLDLKNSLDKQYFDKNREKYLDKLLLAIETSLRVQNGEIINYLDQVRNIYDIHPELQDDSDVQGIIENIKNSREGTLSQKTTNNISIGQIPSKKLPKLFTRAFDMVKTQTQIIFPNLLPEGESVNLNFTDSAQNYCSYMGNYQSRVDINTSVARNANSILSLMAHECYPGHHCDFTLKDYLLNKKENRFEHAFILTQSPSSVIGEGLAELAIDMLYSFEDQCKLSALMCLNPDFEVSVENTRKNEKCSSQLLKILKYNLALYANVEGWTDEQLFNYASQFMPPIRKQWVEYYIKTCKHPVWGSYVFNYNFGKELIVNKYGNPPSPKNFHKLLTSPVLPSDLT